MLGNTMISKDNF